MKILLPLFISLLFSFQSVGQYTQIPDSNFEQALIDLGYDSGPIDGKITTSKVNHVTELTLHAMEIKDLTGIEAFVRLIYLNCNVNELSNLDITKNVDLSILRCARNKLTSLDISKNTILQELNCSFNQITDLNCTNNPNLTKIHCQYNDFHFLDLKNNTKLENLRCMMNSKPFDMDLSQNILLTKLICGGGGLSELDLTKNIALVQLSFSNSHVSTIDLTQNTNLVHLSCAYTELTHLDISKNTKLQNLYCYNNDIQELNIKNNPYLRILYIKNNPIKRIDLSHNTFISTINCSNTPIECLNFGESKSISKSIHLRTLNTPNLHCIDIGKINPKWFTVLELDPGQTLSKNCINPCSSPMDTTNLYSANTTIYPNPSNGNVTISFNQEVVRELEAVLINAIGQEVWSQKLNDVSTFSFEIKGSSGVYFLQLITGSSDPIVYKILKH